MIDMFPARPASFATRLIVFMMSVAAGELRGEEPPVSFLRDVAPILVQRCEVCHGPRQSEGNYRLDTAQRLMQAGDNAEPPIVAGTPADSLIWQLICSADPGLRMPSQGAPLAASELKTIRTWIEQGADFADVAMDQPLAAQLPRPTYAAAPEIYRAPVPITALCAVPGTREVMVGGFRELTIWNADDGSLKKRVPDIAERTTSLAYSPDQQSLAISGGIPGVYGEVRILRANDFSEALVLDTTNDCVLDVAFSPDGSQLAAAFADTTVRVYDVRSGSQLSKIEGHAAGVTAVAWSPDGTQLLSSSYDQTVKVFDVATTSLISTYGGHGAVVHDAIFSSDGTHVYSAGDDAKIHYWQVADSAQKTILKQGGAVFKLLLTSQSLWSVSADRTARQYRIPDHQLVATSKKHDDWVTSLACDTEHGWLLTGSFDGQVRVLESDGANTMHELEAAPGLLQQTDLERLLSATALVRGLEETALRQMVPAQSGLRYVGCPNCTAGRQEDQLDWEPERPDELHCRFCQHRYPSQQYPMGDAVEVHNPRGEKVAFPYWADSNGYRYFFQAHRDDEARAYLADRTLDLALLYAATNQAVYARRAAVLLDRFAEVFPGWCYHYDYPFKQKHIYDGDVVPQDFRSNYRTARWTWWAYSDIPLPLVRAYRLLRSSQAFDQLSEEQGVDVAARIEQDLFRNAAEQVIANSDSLTNMSPRAWQGLVEVGITLNEPRYIHEVARRLRRLTESRFFYDGTWSEGSPDYAAQTVGGLQRVLTLLQGYSDPPGFRDSQDGSRFDRLDPVIAFPSLMHARWALEKMRLPNGRSLPIHDTWSTSQRGATQVTQPYLLPALGHACLGGGVDDQQTQLHLTWSGGYGHEHADNLSLLLYAHGNEWLSDIGYTHTAYRAWTLSTVAHNTVVIDGQSQAFGRSAAPTDGSLRYFDVHHAPVQFVSADGRRGYPGLAQTYRRSIAVIDAGQGRRYAVDHFKVAGGTTHDYFLHGNADTASELSTDDVDLRPLETLLPTEYDWQPTRNEGETSRAAESYYAYGFLRELRSCQLLNRRNVEVQFRGASGTGPGLRICLMPENNCQLITGVNPSIRQAAEDDAKLSHFNRPFLALRHRPQDGGSSFVSLLEPYSDQPAIDSIERVPLDSEAVAVRVTIGARTDFIVFDAIEEVTLAAGDQPVKFQGEFGVLSLVDETVETAYALGAGGWSRGSYQLSSPGPQSSLLTGVQDDVLVVEGPIQPLPAPGTILRLLTADGWVYPYTLASAEARDNTVHLTVREGPGFDYDPKMQAMRFNSFPQRQYLGEITVQWCSPSVQRFGP